MQTVSSGSDQALAAPSLTSQYWSWRGHLIHYVQMGPIDSPHPPLLLVHGFGASTDHWRKTILGLSSEFQVWAIDLLGYGRSPKVEADYGAPLWSAQLQDFITEVIGRPVAITGNSLGGYLSLYTTVKHPGSICGVALLNSAGRFTPKTPLPEPSPTRKFMGKALGGLFRQRWANYLVFQYVRRKSFIRKTLGKVYLDPSAITDQLIEEIHRPSCDPGAATVFASLFRNPPNSETLDELLRELQCPLLTLWGEGDPWMDSRSRGIQFREYFPALDEYYVHAGHCPHDEAPDQVNPILRTWLLGLSEHSRD